MAPGPGTAETAEVPQPVMPKLPSFATTCMLRPKAARSERRAGVPAEPLPVTGPLRLGGLAKALYVTENWQAALGSCPLTPSGQVAQQPAVAQQGMPQQQQKRMPQSTPKQEVQQPAMAHQQVPQQPSLATPSSTQQHSTTRHPSHARAQHAAAGSLAGPAGHAGMPAMPLQPATPLMAQSQQRQQKMQQAILAQQAQQQQALQQQANLAQQMRQQAAMEQQATLAQQQVVQQQASLAQQQAMQQQAAQAALAAQQQAMQQQAALAAQQQAMQHQANLAQHAMRQEQAMRQQVAMQQQQALQQQATLAQQQARQATLAQQHGMQQQASLPLLAPHIAPSTPMRPGPPNAPPGVVVTPVRVLRSPEGFELPDWTHRHAHPSWSRCSNCSMSRGQTRSRPCIGACTTSVARRTTSRLPSGTSTWSSPSSATTTSS